MTPLLDPGGWTPRDVVWGSDEAGTEIATVGENECHICLVGAVEPQNALNFGFGAVNPIIHQLVRNLKPLKFEDRAKAPGLSGISKNTFKS